MFSSTADKVITRSFNEKTDSNRFFSVYSVSKKDFLYKKGRELAEDVYREVWNTDKLVDGNDYSIIVTINNQVVGNGNIQTRKLSSLLKSEKFFQEKHWKGHININPSEIAEISGLAIHRSLDLCDRKLVMMLLIIGGHRLCLEHNIKFWTSIQRKALNRILVKNLRIPFFANQIIDNPSQELPQDKYWDGGEIPKLYYLDLTDGKTYDAIQSFFLHPSMISSKPKFISMIRDDYSSYQRNAIDPSNLLEALT